MSRYDPCFTAFCSISNQPAHGLPSCLRRYVARPYTITSQRRDRIPASRPALEALTPATPQPYPALPAPLPSPRNQHHHRQANICTTIPASLKPRSREQSAAATSGRSPAPGGGRYQRSEPSLSSGTRGWVSCAFRSARRPGIVLGF